MRVSEEEEWLGADFCEHGINVRKNETKIEKNGNEEQGGTRGEVNAACCEGYEESEREFSDRRKEQNSDGDVREMEEHGYIEDNLDIDIHP